MKTRNKLLIILLVVPVLASVFLSCGKPDEGNADDTEYTLTFVTDGGTQISPITNIGGVMIVPPADPTKNGYRFVGWYDNSEFDGETVTLPTVMPNKNVTYYARFESTASQATSRITYEYNLGVVSKNGNVSDTEGNVGDTVTVKDGGAFKPTGYKFVGWTVTQSGTVSLSNVKNDGQFNAGDQITLGDKPLKLYAQWAREYTDARESSTDKIYVYAPLVGHGLGAAILVREGLPDKLGFVADAEETGSGYDEFEFYFDESEGGNVTGRLYTDFTYAVSDGLNGEYLCYDYATDTDLPFILALDGFGFAIYSEAVGDYVAVRASGYYEYDATYSDYYFLYNTPDKPQDLYETHFSLMTEEVADTEFDGRFMLQGEESGIFVEYCNGEILDVCIALNGYGYMINYGSNYDGSDYIIAAQGEYRATDVDGEWRFISGVNGFRFILSTVNIDGEIYAVYIVFDESMYGEFTCGDDTLYLDGYGGALYTVAGEEYVGECTVSENGLVTMAYTVQSDDGETAVEWMYFNLDRTNKTFKANTEGFAVDGTTLIGYSGSAKIITLPDEITAVADNALSALKTDVSLISVTIPAGVTSIGIRAFQNNNTLRRAIFLSETPIEIDFSAANSPFRWPSGSFVIVVPETAVDAYRAAWSDCPYTIKGSVEVTLLPEFEIENGVLIRYNKQPGSAEILDITIPDEVTRIADGVFRGADYLRSVDLNNVTVIGAGAFENCENLVSVVFTNVEEVGEAAFSGCISLRTSGVDSEDVELPAVTMLGDSAFASCFSLMNVVLGENIIVIGDSAFYQCCIYNDRPALMVWLQCDEPPTMGNGIAVGNISFRLRVNAVSVALACYADESWTAYVRHLYIESGEEKGRYMCGDVVLDLDGRAEYQSSEVWMYEIDGDKITFYIYDDETNTVSTIVGDVTDNGIGFTYGGTAMSFVKAGERATYVSDDGKYTLECDPASLLPEAYADSSYVGYANVTFNGVNTQMYIGGYTTKIIYNFLDSDGERYDFTISFRGNVLVYSKKLSQRYVRNITAADGSVINLHFTATTIYVFGELKIKVDGETTLPEFSDYGTPATESGNVYTFTCTYKQTVYTIIATVSDDMTTFTYTYTSRALN